MSTSDLYILNQKSTTWLAEFRNSYGLPFRCWDYLGDKYIAEKPIYKMDSAHLDKVWALHKDSRLSREEKICLLITFDKAYIPLDKIEEAAKACEVFGIACENGRSQNNWPDLAVELRKAAKRKFNRNARGLVLSGTSVNDPWIDANREWLTGAWSIFK